jgi:hypothetical protein
MEPSFKIVDRGQPPNNPTSNNAVSEVQESSSNLNESDSPTQKRRRIKLKGPVADIIHRKNCMRLVWERQRHALYFGEAVDGCFAEWFVTAYFRVEMQDLFYRKWFLDSVCNWDAEVLRYLHKVEIEP